ncbi:hypothetical protein AAMO2058_000069000 [Amorphochlora amoebiformis]
MNISKRPANAPQIGNFPHKLQFAWLTSSLTPASIVNLQRELHTAREDTQTKAECGDAKISRGQPQARRTKRKHMIPNHQAHQDAKKEKRAESKLSKITLRAETHNLQS